MPNHMKTPKTSLFSHFLDVLGPPVPSGLFFNNWRPSPLLLFNFMQKTRKTDESFLRLCVVEERLDE